MNEIETTKTQEIESFSQVISKHSVTTAQAEALPLMAFGLDKTTVIKETGISAQSYDNWLVDPKFLAALSEYRAHIELYHEYKLNQAGALAWNRIFEILQDETSTLSDRDRIALLNVQKDVSKFVVQQLKINSDQTDLNITATSQLYVTEDSADIIARKVRELQSQNGVPVVDAEYRPIDEENITDLEVKQIESSPVPILEGMEYGVLDRKNGKIRCHVCGEYQTDLVSHVIDEHGMDIYGYRSVYGLKEEVFTTTVK